MRELRDGQRVWLRDDLEDGVQYGDLRWDSFKKKGCAIKFTNLIENEKFISEGELCDEEYSIQMIDWDKTDDMLNTNSFSINLKTDKKFMTVVFSGKTGSMIKQEEGSIITAENLDKEDIMNHIKDVMK